MRDFIVFYMGMEGSSAIITHLGKSDRVNTIGLEPFDHHHMKKKLAGDDLYRTMDLVFNKSLNDDYMSKLRSIYGEYTDLKISDFDKSKSVGFKMRPRHIGVMINVLKKNDVVPFVLIRKDLIRFGISLYDKENSQFKLRKGEINSNPQITVNIDKLRVFINNARSRNKKKQKLIEELKVGGLDVHTLYYEDYCADKYNFFKNFFCKLGVLLEDNELIGLANKNIIYKKVHGHDLSKFVTNYAELCKEFGGDLNELYQAGSISKIRTAAKGYFYRGLSVRNWSRAVYNRIKG